MAIVRMLVPIESNDPASWQLALLCAEQINQASTPRVTDVVLLLPTKDLLNYSSLAGFLGAAHAKMLKAGKPLNLPSGATLRVETKRTISFSFGRKTTVIAFYADDRILEEIDGLKNVAGVVAVPEFPGDADEWKARWSPIVPGEAASAPVDLIKDRVVVKALESLSAIVNKSKGLLTSPYHDWANDVLRILRAKGHSAQPKDIKSWAIRDGWSPGAANDLAKLAQKIFTMKTKPSLAGIANVEERYKRWGG